MHCFKRRRHKVANKYVLWQLYLESTTKLLLVVMDVTMGSFFKPEKNLEFFRLKNEPIDDYPGKLE